MPEINDMHSYEVVDQAARELAAFLWATSDVVGHGSFLRASDIWINTMESFIWPDGNFEKFFRNITVQATAQFFAHPAAGISYEEKDIASCVVSSTAISNPCFVAAKNLSFMKN